MKTTRTIIFAAFILLCQVCRAAHSVDPIVVPILGVTSGGVVAPTMVRIPDAIEWWFGWDPDYDGHFTGSNSTPFLHGHALKEFPVVGNILVNNTLGQSQLVNAEDVDAVYELQFPASQTLSPSSLAMNCHGLTTMKAYWIDTSFAGIGYVFGQEYLSVAGYNEPLERVFQRGTLLISTRNHSFIQVCATATFGPITYYYPTHVVEKFNVGPFMKSNSTAYLTVDPAALWSYTNKK